MRIPVLVVLFLGVAVPSASAQPAMDVVEPESEVLYFGGLYLDEPSPTQRIRVRNVGDRGAQALEEVAPYPFEIVASGGDLSAGGEMYWDIRCTPFDNEPWGDSFWLNWCTQFCDFEGNIRVSMTCHANVLSVPSRYNSLPAVYADETAELDVPVSNPGSEPIVVDGASTEPPFTASLPAGPVTLGPGESRTIHVTYRPDGQQEAVGTVDVLAGGRVAARFEVSGSRRSQIAPAGWGFLSMPLGAAYTVPISIRNASSAARTITGASFDVDGASVWDVVGAALAPGETLTALVTASPPVVGPWIAAMNVAFDTGAGDSMVLRADVGPADFAVETEDDVPDDGRLDFGLLPLDSPPVERAFRIVNRSRDAREIAACPPAIPQVEVVSGCPVTIGGGGSADLVVRFTPSAVGPVMTGTAADLSGGATILLAVSARVLADSLAVSRGSIEFPDTVVLETRTETVTVTNQGARPVVLPVEIAGDGFSVDAAASVAVPAEGAASVTVSFQPPVEGTYTGQLAIGDESDPGRLLVPLAGRGVEPDGGDEDGGDDGGDADDDGGDDDAGDDSGDDGNDDDGGDDGNDDDGNDDAADDVSDGGRGDDGCSAAGSGGGGPGAALVLVGLFRRRRVARRRGNAASANRPDVALNGPIPAHVVDHTRLGIADTAGRSGDRLARPLVEAQHELHRIAGRLLDGSDLLIVDEEVDMVRRPLGRIDMEVGDVDGDVDPPELVDDSRIAEWVHAEADPGGRGPGVLAEDLADADLRRAIRLVLVPDHPQREVVARCQGAPGSQLEIAVGRRVGDSVHLRLAHDALGVEAVLPARAACWPREQPCLERRALDVSVVLWTPGLLIGVDPQLEVPLHEAEIGRRLSPG